MKKMNNSRKNKSVRNIVINFVKANGPASWTQLHKVVLAVTGQPLNRTNYGSCYLDKYSWGTSACLPTATDSTYLVWSPVDEKYHVVNE